MTSPPKSPAEQIREWKERVEAIDLSWVEELCREQEKETLKQAIVYKGLAAESYLVERVVMWRSRAEAVASTRTELPRARRALMYLASLCNDDSIALAQVAAILRGEV